MAVEGSPYKFDDARKAQYLALLESGMRRSAAAKAVGVSRATVCHHINADENFRAARDEAEMVANEAVEDALYTAALSGNVVACQVWLYNRSPERWADRRYNHQQITGAGGGPIQISWVEQLMAACAEEEGAADGDGDGDGDTDGL